MMTQDELFLALKPRLLAKGFEIDRVNNFLAWNKKNPWVWPAIIEYLLKAKKDGKTSIGMKKVFEDLREDARFKKQSYFKLNNDWTCLYGHSVVIAYPNAKVLLRLDPVRKSAKFYLSKQAA